MVSTSGVMEPERAKGESWDGRRADARRNHERVLAAAAEVFTEHGLDATIPQVAARAGVGKATVYRSYPTKADLVNALAQVHIDWFKDLVATAAGRADADAGAALASFLDQIASRLAQDRLMIEILGGSGGIRDDLSAAQLEHVLVRGREQGVLRRDVSMLDIQVLVSGFARALIARDVRDVEVWHRYASLTMAALRP